MMIHDSFRSMATYHWRRLQQKEEASFGQEKSKSRASASPEYYFRIRPLMFEGKEG